MQVRFIVLVLFLVSFLEEIKSTNELSENSFQRLYKRDIESDPFERIRLYHQLKRFWKNSWSKTKRRAEKFAETVTAVTDIFKGTKNSDRHHELRGGIFGKIAGHIKGILEPHSRDEHYKEVTVKEKEVTTTTTEAPLKEHGNFDFFGRDAIREIGGLASETGKKIEEFVSSTVPGGLDVKNGSLFGGAVEKFKDHVKAIYPGTLWCGDGNIAKDPTDLGHFNDTDACCREHDHCPDSILAGEKKYGLENTGLFTRSNCDCDTKFYDCLKKTKSAVSEKIGFTFFTVLGPQCYKEEKIISSCEKTEHGKCVKYEFKETDEKKYQWFDTPTF